MLSVKGEHHLQEIELAGYSSKSISPKTGEQQVGRDRRPVSAEYSYHTHFKKSPSFVLTPSGVKAYKDNVLGSGLSGTAYHFKSTTTSIENSDLVVKEVDLTPSLERRRETVEALSREASFNKVVHGIGELKFIGNGEYKKAHLIMKKLPDSIKSILSNTKRKKQLIEQYFSSKEKFLTLFREILYATRDLHKRNIIHGDICPGNTCLGDNGKVTFCDFGFARFVGEEVCSHYSVSDSHYAPEFLLSGTVAHASQDVFALGYILKNWPRELKCSWVRDDLVELSLKMRVESAYDRPTLNEVIEKVDSLLLKSAVKTGVAPSSDGAIRSLLAVEAQKNDKPKKVLRDESQLALSSSSSISDAKQTMEQYAPIGEVEADSDDEHDSFVRAMASQFTR